MSGEIIKPEFPGAQGTATGAGPIDSTVQRVTVATDIIIDSCDSIVGWAAGLAAADLAASLDHILGSHSLTFDKIAGNVTAIIEKTIPAVDADGFNPSDIISSELYLANLANVVHAFIRLGTDNANYNEWRLPVADMMAAQWLIWSPSIGAQEAFAGNGIDISSIQYVAFGVEFNAAGDLLNDILIDHIYLRKVIATGAQIHAEITTSISSPDVNLHEVRGTATAVDHGPSNAGTQRVAANPIPTQNGVTGGAGATDAATQRAAANVHDGAGSPALDADPLPVEVGDGVNRLIVALRGLVSVGNGLLGMQEYNAVPPPVADGEQVPRQGNAYGLSIGVSDNLATGSRQITDISPILHNPLTAEARPAGALPAAGAFDAAPGEITTGGRKKVQISFLYDDDPAATNGRGKYMVELCRTESGTDVWGPLSAGEQQPTVQGANTETWIQPDEFEFDPAAAAEEGIVRLFDITGAHKIRIPCAESGDIANPGQCRVILGFDN